MTRLQSEKDGSRSQWSACQSMCFFFSFFPANLLAINVLYHPDASQKLYKYYDN